MFRTLLNLKWYVGVSIAWAYQKEPYICRDSQIYLRNNMALVWHTTRSRVWHGVSGGSKGGQGVMFPPGLFFWKTQDAWYTRVDGSVVDHGFWTLHLGLESHSIYLTSYYHIIAIGIRLLINLWFHLVLWMLGLVWLSDYFWGGLDKEGIRIWG